MTSDSEVLKRVKALVDEEHSLRGQATDGGVSPSITGARLSELEQALDQCWDLLRQRQALRDFGRDPDEASARPVNQVENYLG
ncbi:MAG: DUF2630 family protein [Dermatophilaceae bacterium]